jgi:hypothetical protein
MTRRCQASVYRRDTYRVHRQGGRHFKLHFTEGQCKRPARQGSDFCPQHDRETTPGYVVTRCKWAEPFMEPAQ